MKGKDGVQGSAGRESGISDVEMLIVRTALKSRGAEKTAAFLLKPVFSWFLFSKRFASWD